MIAGHHHHYQHYRVSPKNALSESSSFWPEVSASQVNPPMAWEGWEFLWGWGAGWWFWKCVFLGHPVAPFRPPGSGPRLDCLARIQFGQVHFGEKPWKTNLESWKTNLEPLKTMQTNLEPWKPCKPTSKHEKPWKTNLEPWKTMKNDLETWKTIMEPWKTNLEPWKIMKTDLDAWKTTKNQPGTIGTMKNQPGTMKKHENRPQSMKNH